MLRRNWRIFEGILKTGASNKHCYYTMLTPPTVMRKNIVAPECSYICAVFPIFVLSFRFSQAFEYLISYHRDFLLPRREVYYDYCLFCNTSKTVKNNTRPCMNLCKHTLNSYKGCYKII